MSVLRRDDCGEKNASEVLARRRCRRQRQPSFERMGRSTTRTTTTKDDDARRNRNRNLCTSGGGVAKCDKVGYVPAKKNTLFTFRLPFGWTREEGREDETTTKMKKKKGGKKDKTEANTLERCSVCSANGKLACGRCNGQGVLLYRSADWR